MQELTALRPALEAASFLAIVATLAVYIYLGISARRQIAAMSKQIEATTNQTRTNARQQAWHDLFEQFDHINDYARTHNVEILNPYPALQSGASAPLLMHHLNLMFRFHVNRELFLDDERQGFDRWLKNVFFAWIAENPPLKNDFGQILNLGDLYPESFLRWLREHPAYAGAVRRGREV